MLYKAEVARKLPEKLADEDTLSHIKFISSLLNFVILIVFTNLLEKILIIYIPDFGNNYRISKIRE